MLYHEIMAEYDVVTARKLISFLYAEKNAVIHHKLYDGRMLPEYDDAAIQEFLKINANSNQAGSSNQADKPSDAKVPEHAGKSGQQLGLLPHDNKL